MSDLISTLSKEILVGMLLMLLLLSAFSPSPPEGVWMSQGDSERVYISITAEGEVTIYDSNWYPFQLMKAEVSSDALRAEAVPEGTVMNFILEGRFEGERIEGTQLYPHPQYPMENPFRAIRIASKAVQFTINTLSTEKLEGEPINVVKFISEKAPTDNLGAFRNFWEESVEPRFLPFLLPMLEPLWVLDDETAPQAKDERLAALMKDLSELTQSVPSDGAEEAGRDGLSPAVIVPCLTGDGQCEPYSVEVPASKISYPAGHRLCCGDLRYASQALQVFPVKTAAGEKPQEKP